jgi:hypothetical protein
LRKKNIFIYVALGLFAIIFCVVAFNKLFFGKPGVGPVVNGFQLGVPTTVADFAQASVNCFGGGNLLVYALDKEPRVEVGGISVSLDKNRWKLLGNSGVFSNLTADNASMNELLTIIGKETEKYPEGYIFFITPDGAGMTAVNKLNYGPFKYAVLKFNRSSLGFEKTQGEDFAQEMIDRYHFVNLVTSPDSPGGQTSDEDALKRGWSVSINSSVMHLNVINPKK